MHAFESEPWFRFKSCPWARFVEPERTVDFLQLFCRMSHSCRVDGGSSRTSVSIHGLGYLLTALRCQGLIPDELVLQLATFLRSHDLFLELRLRTPQTLTANQVRQGGKQGTDGCERSRIHSSTQHPRDKRREASAHGADQQRLQQGPDNVPLYAPSCASLRIASPLTTKQTQYSPPVPLRPTDQRSGLR